MHVGNLRTALFAWLIARSSGGTFILRIEDTDQERKVEGAVDLIYRTLADAGLDHDEGPDVGGDTGPYVQSERMARGVYAECAETLIAKGAAYRCFCSKERLDEVRAACERDKRPIRYDGHCMGLPKEEVEARARAGEPYVVRHKVPTEGSTTFHDEVYGDVTVDNATLGDIVLVKSDGYPTYNFANVVDDHLMGITHVVRGSEYVISTPIYNHIYDAFGWERPIYVHVPPVMRDHQRKLSKRDGDASYADFIEKGCLKEALINYVALLGWNPGDGREKLSLADLVASFGISGISKSPAIFDEAKLRWLSGEYVRSLSPREFQERAMPWIKKAVARDDIDFAVLCEGLQKRAEYLSEVPPQLDFIDSLPEHSTELYVNAKMKMDLPSSLAALKSFRPALEAIEPWDRHAIYERACALAAEAGLDKKTLLGALRAALSGKAQTPGGATDLAAILGKRDSLSRVDRAIERLSRA
jgi:glutamyl-tRNA synthetase